MKIHKGDLVKIRVGKDAGKSGKVIKIDAKTSKILLEGLNLCKKHVKPKRQGEKGETITVPRPIAVANLSLICAVCKKMVRVGYRLEGKNKKRYCKKCQASI